MGTGPAACALRHRKPWPAEGAAQPAAKDHHRCGTQGGSAGRPPGGIPPAREQSRLRAWYPCRKPPRLFWGGGRPAKKRSKRILNCWQSWGQNFISCARPAGRSETGRRPGVCRGGAPAAAGQVLRRAGYDGVYGVIGLFEPEELEELNGQTTFLIAERKSKIKQAGLCRPANKIRLASGKPDEPAGRAAGGPQEEVRLPA